MILRGHRGWVWSLICGDWTGRSPDYVVVIALSRLAMGSPRLMPKSRASMEDHCDALWVCILKVALCHQTCCLMVRVIVGLDQKAR